MIVSQKQSITPCHLNQVADIVLVHVRNTNVKSRNTFRIIFNKYFQANLDLLPNISYFSTYNRNYDFLDATPILNTSLQTLLTPS